MTGRSLLSGRRQRSDWSKVKMRSRKRSSCSPMALKTSSSRSRYSEPRSSSLISTRNKNYCKRMYSYKSLMSAGKMRTLWRR